MITCIDITSVLTVIIHMNLGKLILLGFLSTSVPGENLWGQVVQDFIRPPDAFPISYHEPTVSKHYKGNSRLLGKPTTLSQNEFLQLNNAQIRMITQMRNMKHKIT